MLLNLLCELFTRPFLLPSFISAHGASLQLETGLSVACIFSCDKAQAKRFLSFPLQKSFYWEKSVSDSKSAWSIFEDIYVNIGMWLLPKQTLPVSPKKHIKLLLPDAKDSLKFVFIMLTDHCKIYIMFLIPWKFRGIFTIGNSCLKGYVWRMQRNAAKFLEEL